MSKPKMKVEYVQVDKNGDGGAYWECAKDFAEGVEFTVKANELQIGVGIEDLLARYKSGNLYRKIETAVTWGDILVKTLKTKGKPVGNGSVQVGSVDLSDDDFIQMVSDIYHNVNDKD